FASRYALIDKQGNFGTADGDRPAAMRYTEARLSALAMGWLRGIGADTVALPRNYCSQPQEPVVVPARCPNLLCNGSGGIAVAMTTNIPPHNLGEVVDAAVALLDNPTLSAGDLLGYIKGADFPTRALVMSSC